MSQDDTEIKERFGTSISQEDLARYDDLRRKKEGVSLAFGLLSVIILVLLIYILLTEMFVPYLFYGLLAGLFLLLLAARPIQKPFDKRMAETGLNREILLQYKLNSAIIAYNEGNYEESFKYLENIDDGLHSNSDYFMGRDQDMQTYVRRLRNSENKESEIEDTFPTIAQILISEQDTKHENTKEFNNILNRLSDDRYDDEAPSIGSIYKEEVLHFLTREKIGVVIVLAYSVGVLAVFFHWSQELAMVLAGLGVAFGLLLNILGITD